MICDQNKTINPSRLAGLSLSQQTIICSDIQVQKCRTTDSQKTTDVVTSTPKCVKSCCLDCDTEICQESDNLGSDALVRKLSEKLCQKQ